MTPPPSPTWQPGVRQGLVITHFVPVPDVDALNRWIPRAGLVLLFLHDPGCGTSRAAYKEVARLGGEVALVDVRRARDVSAEIQARTGVRHESPQVIALRDGRPAWAASHRATTVGAIAGAVSGAGRYTRAGRGIPNGRVCDHDPDSGWPEGKPRSQADR